MTIQTNVVISLKVGTLEAQDLELTVETLRCRQDAEKSSLVKKVTNEFGQ